MDGVTKGFAFDIGRAASSRKPVFPASLPHLDVPAAASKSLAAAVEAGRSAGAAFGPGQTIKAITQRGTTIGGLPPSDEVTREELALMHAVAAARTPEGIAAANEYGFNGHHNTWRLELERIKPTLSVNDAKRAARLLESALSSAREAADTRKAEFKRPRPYDTDPTLTTAIRRPTNASFPSGHAASAAAGAAVLSAFAPAERQHFADLAVQVAWSRTYGGVHYPSDTASGAELGAFIGAALLAAEAGRSA